MCAGSIDVCASFLCCLRWGSLRAELSGAHLGLVARAATLDLTHQNGMRAAALKVLSDSLSESLLDTFSILWCFEDVTQ